MRLPLHCQADSQTKRGTRQSNSVYNDNLFNIFITIDKIEPSFYHQNPTKEKE